MKSRHVMIRASAGSGKTYALTNRFVALLAAGARPERIVALTFTRKAAGEFFDEILQKLARAAREPAAAAQLARDVERPELGPAEFLAMLRDVVESMPRLRLGTLDGFFGRMARAFPLELGLTGEFEVLQEHAAQTERRRVWQRMFAHVPGGLDGAQRDFIEAFKRATFGTEEKRLGARLDAFLDEHQEIFLAAPEAELWGSPERIWPEGGAWWPVPRRARGEAAAALRALLARRNLPENQWERWTAFFDALSEWVPGAPLPEAVAYLLKNILAVWADVRRGAAEITVDRKKCALGSEECAELATLVAHLVGGEMGRQLETTRGIHAVLAAYEAVYHDAVRRAGKLTFGDVQRLLEPGTSGRQLASGGAGGEGRLLIDYRLDGKFDHWLLDEFQDTSHGQWRILENLIDEAVQDAAGARSFFCVGDVKQAIFAWREGDRKLFRDILDRYNTAAPDTIVEAELVKSFRSGPAVIAMVNAVFGGSAAIAELFPGPMSADWNEEWSAHVSAQPQLGGYAAWWHAADEAERFARTVKLLVEIAPWERGLECAVLVQSNATATELADYLRREGGIPAVAESDLHVGIDNPLGAALLAIVQAAAHPGDTFAREHVAMSPLGGLLAADGVDSPEALTAGVLGQIDADGFERTMEAWVRRLDGALAPDDVFSRQRGRQIVAAAALFDATGSRDVDEFVAFVERHAVRGTEMSGVVRVMTIHKAKGLGFDLVVLPDLEGNRIDQRRDGLAVERAEDRSVQWVLDLPAKLFSAQDEILSRHVMAGEAEGGYEALSLLYVGLTRAKRAMYVISTSPGKSKSRNYPKLLAATLGDEPWSCGDERWYETLPPAPVIDARGEGEARPALAETSRVPRRMSLRPSTELGGVVAAVQLLAAENSKAQAAEFGTAVHALLAQVDRGREPPLVEWRAKGVPEAAIEEALACVQAAALSGIWEVPLGAEVRRERSFEIVLDGMWVTGVFDRVVVERRADGGVETVNVWDFKTDRVADTVAVAAAVERHTRQMNLYRRVAAALWSVPSAQVNCELVFTFLRERRRVPQR